MWASWSVMLPFWVWGEAVGLCWNGLYSRHYCQIRDISNRHSRLSPPGPQKVGPSPTSKLGHTGDIRTFDALFGRDGFPPFLVSIIFNHTSLENKFYCEIFTITPIPFRLRWKAWLRRASTAFEEFTCKLMRSVLLWYFQYWPTWCMASSTKGMNLSLPSARKIRWKLFS